MVYKSFKEILKTSLNPGLVGILASIKLSLKYRRPYNCFHSDDNTWNAYCGGFKIASPYLYTQDPDHIKQKVHNVWLRDTTLGQGSTVVDIGAGCGDEVIFFSRLVGANGKVIAIESDPLVYKSLRKTILINKLENVLPVCLTISDSNQQFVSSNDANHISRSPRPFGLKSSSPSGELLQSVSLEDFLRTNNIRAVDFLKVNIEGAEVLALRSLSIESFTRIKSGVIECHDFKYHETGDAWYKTCEEVSKIISNLGGVCVSYISPALSRREERYTIYFQTGFHGREASSHNQDLQ